jgi:hypothetical protein
MRGNEIRNSLIYFCSIQIITWIYKERKVRTSRGKDRFYNSKVSITERNNF